MNRRAPEHRRDARAASRQSRFLEAKVMDEALRVDDPRLSGKILGCGPPQVELAEFQRLEIECLPDALEALADVDQVVQHRLATQDCEADALRAGAAAQVERNALGDLRRDHKTQRSRSSSSVHCEAMSTPCDALVIVLRRHACGSVRPAEGVAARCVGAVGLVRVAVHQGPRVERVVEAAHLVLDGEQAPARCRDRGCRGSAIRARSDAW